MQVSGAQTGTVQQRDNTKLNADFDQFLLLLTTQLQNQDPLAPMDTNDFTNQLVQFSGVEQQIKSNTLLQNLLAAQTLNMTALGVSFIGKNVEVLGKDFQSDGSTPVTLTYEMPSTAASGTVSITDKNGAVVYSSTAELTTGIHSFTWNGKDKNGNPVMPGTYTVKVGALGTDKTALNVSTYVPGYVNSLETADDGSLVLDINDRKVALSDVRKISAGTNVSGNQTSEIDFTTVAAMTLNLSRSAESASYPLASDATPNFSRSITVYDKTGKPQELNVRFYKHDDPGENTPNLLAPLAETANSSGWWEVEFTNSTGTVISEGSINFRANGSLNAVRDSDAKTNISLNNINWGISGTPTQNIQFNIANFQHFAGPFSVSAISQDGSESSS